MAHFIQIQQPLQHDGVARAQNAVQSIKDVAHSFDGARGTATLLLAAIVSALLVATNQVIDRVSEGHLLLAWMALWSIAFTALALLAAPMRRAAVGLRNSLAAWKENHRAAMEDEKLWNVALRDARVMADLSRAMEQNSQRNDR